MSNSASATASPADRTGSSPRRSSVTHFRCPAKAVTAIPRRSSAWGRRRDRRRAPGVRNSKPSRRAVAAGEIDEACGSQHCADDDADRHEGEEYQHAGIAFKVAGMKHRGPEETRADTDHAANDRAEKQADQREHDFHNNLRVVGWAVRAAGSVRVGKIVRAHCPRGKAQHAILPTLLRKML